MSQKILMKRDIHFSIQQEQQIRTVRNSLSDDDFQEYSFTAGVTDDGVGEPLPEFSQFQIKIVMQGTDAAQSTTYQRFTSYCTGDIR